MYFASEINEGHQIFDMGIYALRVNQLEFRHFLKVMLHEKFLECVVINSFGGSINCRKDTGGGPNKEGRR